MYNKQASNYVSVMNMWLFSNAATFLVKQN